MDRAYSILEVKSFEEDKRILTGVATTPTPDRVGDIVEPLGVKFNNPLPLLHQHRSDQPVGQVTFKRPTKQGITFEARLPHIKEEGPLKTRVDTAWAEIKAGLVRGVSIGFRSIDSEFMDNGGVRFKESEVFELSLVTIPANAEANIQTIKSFDMAALGQDQGKTTDPQKLPASREQNVNKPKTKEKKVMSQTTAEKISAFEASRQAKSARMEAIMEDSGDETLDESDAEEYETLKGEVGKIDKHLDRLYDLSKLQAAKAKPVAGDNHKEASESRGGDPIRVKVSDPVLPKGIGFARLARCKAIAKVDGLIAADVARQLYPDHTELEHILKTSIPAGSTTVTGFGGALVQNSNVFSDFVDYLRPMTIIGRFGADGVPSMRRVPFRTYLPSMTAGTTGYWVDEGAGKPVSKPTLATTYLTPYKCAAIAVVTMELLRDSNPSVEALIRQDLARAVAAKLDTDFLDPQKAVSLPAGSPASISNGVTKQNSAGRDADSVRSDLVTLFTAYISANNIPTSGVWVMSAVTALQLSLMTNALGQPEFPGISMTGGRLQGLPVLCSEYLGYTTDSPVEGRDVFLINANDIWFADDGGVDVAMSTEATLEMTDVPAGNSVTPTAGSTNYVSMWQSNSIAFRAERSVSWAKRRAEAVQYMSQVEWGENADSATQP